MATTWGRFTKTEFGMFGGPLSVAQFEREQLVDLRPRQSSSRNADASTTARPLADTMTSPAVTPAFALTPAGVTPTTDDRAGHIEDVRRLRCPRIA